MAIDERTGRGTSRHPGDGLRHGRGEPDPGEPPIWAPPGREVARRAALPPADADITASLPASIMPGRAPNLDLVFDDPRHGEPGRDRVLVHGIWELLLAVAVIGVGLLLYRRQPAVLGNEGLRTLLLEATALGLLAAASALALRAAAPNLAVGAVAVVAAVYFSHRSDGQLLRPLLVVAGVALVIGLVQAGLVTGLHVPGWAVSLAVAAVLTVWADRQALAVADVYDPYPYAYWWFGLFCVGSVAAALIGLSTPVRRGLARFRPVANPAQRRGATAALVVIGATVGSSLLAALGGVVTRAAGSATPPDPVQLTLLGLAVALLGGTSAFGRRGGIFGTVFAALLVTLAVALAETGGYGWPVPLVGAVALVAGLAVTRLVERYGRPAPPAAEEPTGWLEPLPRRRVGH